MTDMLLGEAPATCMKRPGAWPIPTRGSDMSKRTVEERFWSKVDRRGDDECWEWTASMYPTGYGHFSIMGQGIRAHRFSYELLVGPIPEGMVIDHLCRTPLCVNPAHLEPVTQRENVLRGVGLPAENARKTHCKHGHELAGANLSLFGGKRRCLACRARWQRERHARSYKKEQG